MRYNGANFQGLRFCIVSNGFEKIGYYPCKAAAPLTISVNSVVIAA
jgi:hypothetical protein